ncbi:DUF724 domain-containing protein 2-like [Salvia miltiorrhiza]|uniref:DUF724 domain-containing protein 2-like n=1 Tax=Salvia miltiorrhiza TaxID=226208 RepID=UPI0025AD7452|nr:DUF724 domain-containing protein 2-like [Salvia miltiorrhiza]
MGADDVEKPQIPPINDRDGHQFPVGSLVEVYVNEENMGDVYFSATVVPPPHSPRKSNTQISGEKLYVKYENLLARKNRPDRLRECVDISIVRPAPPLLQKAAAKRFEPNDVVDAFYNDGWWKGVISSVVGGGERFVVTFENPPDVQEFGPTALRAHWDWADGVWTGLVERKGKMGISAFETGAEVEISLEDAWFPAAIVRDLGNGAYLVEMKDKNGEMVEAQVDFGHIRPCPPIFRERKFGIWEKVDAFFDYGWRSGLIKERVGKNEYIVFFELTNLNRLLNQSELRLHMDWRDGKWFIGGGDTAPPPLKSNSNDSGEKHNSQIEHADQETEHIVDQERRSKRKQDQMRRTPSPSDGSTLAQWIDGSTLLQCRWANSKRRRKLHVAKNYKPPNEIANQENEQILGRQSIDEASKEPNSAVVVAESIEPREHNVLPFVKRSAVWEAVESMEVFRKMPQRPHFEPLRFYKEREREGLAVGCMVTFSNWVELARGLKFSDPRSVVDDLYQTLLDLQAHGFEAGAVREFVVKLVAAKEEEQRLVDEAKRIKDEIEERGCRRSKIEGEMRELNEQIGMLQEKLGMSEMERAKEVEQIELLQAGLEDTRHKIECLAASVFQL